jgi:hypothetical protein
MADFQNQAFNPSERSVEFDTNVFDWQVTPFPVVTEYIRRDFRGVFELEHLAINQEYDATVNTQMSTSHKHAFHPTGDRLSDQDIRSQYPVARAKFEYLADKFRSVLASDGPIVYVLLCRDFVPSVWQIAAFIRCIKQRNPKQAFRLAMVGIEGKYRRPILIWFGGRVSWHVIAAPKDKDVWGGDNESWGRVIGKLHSLRF